MYTATNRNEVGCVKVKSLQTKVDRQSFKHRPSFLKAQQISKLVTQYRIISSLMFTECNSLCKIISALGKDLFPDTSKNEAKITQSNTIHNRQQNIVDILIQIFFYQMYRICSLCTQSRFVGWPSKLHIFFSLLNRYF